MISDPIIEITCDNCGEVIEFEPEFVYDGLMAKTGNYDTRDIIIEEFLRDENWVVTDQGNHYCPECEEEDQ